MAALPGSTRRAPSVRSVRCGRWGRLGSDAAYGTITAVTPRERVKEPGAAPGRVLTHRMLLHEVWGPDCANETQYLRVYASRVRKNLATTAHPALVTEPGRAIASSIRPTSGTAGRSSSASAAGACRCRTG